MGKGNFLSDELSRLRHDVLEMASRVEENLAKAIAALKTGNAELADAVRADDAAVDALQLKIEDDAAVIIATQHPVAGDLRELVTIFKITGNMERIGDYTVHLAKAVKRMAKKGDSPFRAREGLAKMAETGKEMINAAVCAFLAKDAAAAREAAEMDNKIDAQHKALAENVLRQMKKNPDSAKASPKAAFQILQTSSRLERLGDHITNICEAVIYMVEGKHYELNS